MIINVDSVQLYREKLYLNIRELSDVTVICGGTKFECHTAFLASRSPVFKAMFSNDTKEKITNEVHIDDIKSEVMAEMLLYIYTGKTFKLARDKMIARNLLIAADKYQLDSLKELCENRILCHYRLLDCENYFSYLILGFEYSSKIKRYVLDYIVRNKRKIEIEEQLVEYPSLMMELLKVYASSDYHAGDSDPDEDDEEAWEWWNK